VDFAVAFELSWSNGSEVFYVGGGTASLLWQVTDPRDPRDITLLVTMGTPQILNAYDIHREDDDDGQSGQQDIDIPPMAGCVHGFSIYNASIIQGIISYRLFKIPGLRLVQSQDLPHPFIPCRSAYRTLITPSVFPVLHLLSFSYS
jgi:hypothetical protein